MEEEKLENLKISEKIKIMGLSSTEILASAVKIFNATF